jgi:hypothetical protein
MVGVRSVLAVCVAAVCSLQGDASELRGFISAKLLASCNSGSEPAPTTLANAPSSYLSDESTKTCAAGTVAIYIFKDGQWVKFCGKTCIAEETVTADAEVGGQDCAGDKQVTVKLSGANIMTGVTSSFPPKPVYTCVPFGDVKPVSVAAADPANMAGCALADKVFGCMVSRFRTAGAAVGKLATLAGNKLSDKSTKWFNAAGSAVDKTGKALSNAGNAVGNFFGRR